MRLFVIQESNNSFEWFNKIAFLNNQDAWNYIKQKEKKSHLYYRIDIVELSKINKLRRLNGK